MIKTDTTPLCAETTIAVDAAGDLRLAGRRILIVEDEALIAIDLEYALEDAGAVLVGIAPDNRTALALLDTEEVDAVLLDYGLADGEAAPTARAARALGVPVVFHSGHASPAQLRSLFADVPVLRKPSPIDLIIDTLASACLGRVDA